MIYIKLENPVNNLQDLLIEFFSCDAYRGNAKSDFSLYGKETYKDEECNIPHCDKGRYRSFDDTLELAKTYFPDTSHKELFLALLKLNINGYRVNFDVCGDIRRIIIHFFKNSKLNYNYLTYYKKYDSEYSWKELLEMCDIYSQKDLDRIQYE